MPNETNSEADMNRRDVLGLLGGTGAATYLGSGVAGAQSNNGNGPPEDPGGGVGPCTCDDCPDGTFCGKVEGSPEEGETYTFSDNGESYSVTIESTTTKENEDEVTCFEFSSTKDIQQVCIKGGPETNTYSGSDLDGKKLCAPENPGGQQSEISNFSFCGAGCVCHQVDLVWWKEGYPIKDLSANNLYGNDLIEAHHDDTCNDDGPATADEDTDSRKVGDCTFTVDVVDWKVEAGEITAKFDLSTEGECTETTDVQIGLVSYEDDCEYENLTGMDLEDQELVDDTSGTFSDDDEPHELKVDLPT